MFDMLQDMLLKKKVFPHFYIKNGTSIVNTEDSDIPLSVRKISNF